MNNIFIFYDNNLLYLTFIPSHTSYLSHIFYNAHKIKDQKHCSVLLLWGLSTLCVVEHLWPLNKNRIFIRIEIYSYVFFSFPLHRNSMANIFLISHILLLHLKTRQISRQNKRNSYTHMVIMYSESCTLNHFERNSVVVGSNPTQASFL